MIRLIGVTWDEIQTVGDISRELIRKGDPRGYKLKALVEEYARAGTNPPEPQSLDAWRESQENYLRIVGGGGDAA